MFGLRACRGVTPAVRRQLFYAGQRVFSTEQSAQVEHRVAVVGGGAAGFYTAARVLAKTSNVGIDIFEQQIPPHGLVRYGVAPDHPEVKNCTSKFASVSLDPRVRYFGNTKVGTRVGVSDLRSAYDAVVLAYGASEDKRLHIRGEDGHKDRVGVVSARMFVAWYNGLPEAQNLHMDLESHDTVVIVGHGNVALDCARILLAPREHLARTDITHHALSALARSNIRRVEMVGRRGPLQVSFTTKELREMTKLDNVQIVCDRSLVESECASAEEFLAHKRPLRRMMDLLLKHSVCPRDARMEKQFHLRFLMSPTEVQYDNGQHVRLQTNGQLVRLQTNGQLVRFQINELEGPPETARAVPTNTYVDVPCAMALRSVGYASTPLDGVPFDSAMRIVPNIAGRVVSDGDAVRGLYVAGWLKRGPVGVIATTMQDAYRTADALIADLQSGAIGTRNSSIDNMLEQLGIDKTRVTNDDWLRVDAYEVAMGSAKGKPREKLTSVRQMLDVISGSNQ
ncbi:NADPH-adrenodoxin reductase [Coemansia sp. RSA 1822]|nr:NADPH-adrenodoxin reductase [Coemansia sp. RSA 638]KAJ2564588.1 NADPH-adrenodoxin reductase [Coemansia sp. RSA 1822]